MTHRALKVSSVCFMLGFSFMLAGCGEGWEAQRTTSFPYGNQRTAGSAIAYVQAKMMPEKEIKIVPVSRHLEPEALVVEEPEVVPVPEMSETTEKMEEIFTEVQRK